MSQRWESFADIERVTAHAGLSVSKAQLERWRYRGLLAKVRQVGKGRGAGSGVCYPEGTAERCVAIIKLLSIKEKLDFVGWNLWLQGFAVDERYWRSDVEQALRDIRRAPAYVRLMASRYANDEQTAFDAFPFQQISNRKIRNNLKAIPLEMRAYVLSLISDITTGQFSGFSNHNEFEAIIHQNAFLRTAGIVKKGPARAIADDIGFNRYLEPVLIAISDAIVGISLIDRDYFEIPDAARKHFSLSMELAASIDAMFRAAGQSPLGTLLSILNQNIPLQAVILVIWTQPRLQETFLSSPEIAEMLRLSTHFGTNKDPNPPPF